MPVQTASIPNFTIISYWTNTNGAITSGPTTAEVTKTATISGIPDGSVIESAKLEAELGFPYTGISVLKVNGENTGTGSKTFDLTPTETGNGDYGLTVRFRANGASGLSNGEHAASVSVKNAVVTVTYSETEPGPEPEPEPVIDWGGSRPISVFAPDNTDRFNNNGLAVLTPTYGRLSAVAGGKYAITLRHPIDSARKWAYLTPEAIVRVPVPEETIENAFVGIEVDLYRTTQRVSMRDGPSEPSAIAYDAWTAGTSYPIGKRVTSSNQNYQLLDTLTGNEIYASPASLPSKWKKIANYTSGASVLTTLASGSDLYFLEDAGSGWYYMSTPLGIEGYVKASQVTFIRHITPEEMEERTIRDQLFRVVDATVDTKTMEVTVYAEHVSYDLAAILVRDVKISKATPAFAINRVMDGLMAPYRGTVSTNMTTDEYGTYTGEMNGKNGIAALLDPDSGIVPMCGARFARDNWDIFILRNTHRDRGIRMTYGKNVRGITWKRSREKLALRVVPVAKDKEGNDYYLPELYIDSTNISEFPVPRMMRLAVKGQIGKDDGTGTNTKWTADSLCEEMRKKALECFDVDHADQISVEITVDFEQVGDTAEYAWLKDLEQVNLYDIVHAADERVGLEAALTVTELEWDFIRRRITKVKVSTEVDQGFSTVAGYNLSNNSIGIEKLTEAAITEIANLLT